MTVPTSVTPRHQQSHVSPRIPHFGTPGINPQIFGDPPEEDWQYDPDDPRLDPRYTGSTDRLLEDEACFDPDAIKEMEFRKRALWLGKWFAHHYAPWVTSFEMKELENYQIHKKTHFRDIQLSPAPLLCWTFQRFKVPEDEWRSPMFSSPVQLFLLLD